MLVIDLVLSLMYYSIWLYEAESAVDFTEKVLLSLLVIIVAIPILAIDILLSPIEIISIIIWNILKELEKFGFKNRYGFLYKSKFGEKDVIEIEIDLKTRKIKMIGLGDLYYTRDDTLYDLIKADLVEKV